MHRPLRFGSVCSGIEAASAAWESLGWLPVWFAEIEPFPSAVLAHHYPDVPNLGDMTRLPARILAGEIEAPDVFVGGTPCQSFSVAGLRKGLDDPRGQLTRSFVEIADAIDTVRAAQGLPPAIILWENVPGVLSDNGNAFGNFLGALAGEDIALDPSGGKWTNAGLVLGPTREVCWRVLDAQYYGVAQRRRRVFVVAGSRTGGVRASQVLLVESGVRRDSPPSREARQGVAGAAATGADTGGGERGAGRDGGVGIGGEVAGTLDASYYKGCGSANYGEREVVAQTIAFAETPWDAQEKRIHDVRRGVAPTLSSRSSGGGTVDGWFAMPAQHVVAPPLTATNDPSRSPQSSEVTAQVHAVLQAQNWDGQPTSQTLTGRLYGGLGAQMMPDKGNMGAVLQPYPEVADVVGTLSDGAHNGGGLNGQDAYTGRILPVMQPIAFHPTQGPIFSTDGSTHCMGTGTKNGHASIGVCVTGDRTHALKAEGADGSEDGTGRGTPIVPAGSMAVRRLTPRECERLQGFPDDYTKIPWKKKPADECPDGPRYKALGNSMAVPCMNWLGRKIDKEYRKRHAADT